MLGVSDLIGQVFQVTQDSLLALLGQVDPTAGQKIGSVHHLLGYPLIPNVESRLFQLAGSLFLPGFHLAGALMEFSFQSVQIFLQVSFLAQNIAELPQRFRSEFPFLHAGIQVLDFIEDFLLFLNQVLGLLFQLLEVFHQLLPALLTQVRLRLPQTFQGLLGTHLSLLGVLAAGLGSTHVAHRLAETSANILQLGILLLTGQTFQLACHALGLFDEFLLRHVGARGSLWSLPAMALNHLLLAFGQLLQFFQGLIQALFTVELAILLQRLILILGSIQLQIHQIGQILGRGAAPALILGKGDLNFLEKRFGAK